VKLVTTVEATASQAKVDVVNLSEDSDNIDIGEDTTTIRLTEPSHDTLRYLIALAILTILIGCG
jgi:hypothetical protein